MHVNTTQLTRSTKYVVRETYHFLVSDHKTPNLYLPIVLGPPNLNILWGMDLLILTPHMTEVGIRHQRFILPQRPP